MQVLLLVRLPFLEWIAGFDRLTRWHRLNGKVTLYLILAHVGLITIGYALLARQSVLTESSVLLSSYYGIVAALVGTILLVVVVLTSITIVRRQLRFETWYVVHLLTYAGITLSWFHETRTGLDFVTNPWAAALWAGLYIVTLEFVLLFRVLQPALRYWFHRFTVESVTYEGAQATSVRITRKASRMAQCATRAVLPVAVLDARKALGGASLFSVRGSQWEFFTDYV